MSSPSSDTGGMTSSGAAILALAGALPLVLAIVAMALMPHLARAWPACARHTEHGAFALVPNLLALCTVVMYGIALATNHWLHIVVKGTVKTTIDVGLTS